MTASIVPFPLARRRAFIQKQADHATCLNPSASERYLEYQLQVQRDAMRRKGIDEALIQHELLCMRRAIQAIFSANMQQPGGER